MEKEQEKQEKETEKTEDRRGCCGRRCASCENNATCGKSADGTDGCAGGSLGCGGCGVRGKLHSYNYWDDIPGGYADDDMVEVIFKNTRKGYYLNSAKLPLEIGDLVAVEASPGHDIGTVSLTGALVRLQMRKANIKPDAEVRRVFRKAKASDLERYEQAKARENETMIRARKIAADLKLNMKIGDVEYQGDGNKAIFYYIADERVDFRQLIKVLAEAFKVRIEMKQIGARQEAGRIGGIGPCGRPLCCNTWLTNFVSVSTAAARFQDISLNPQKLAGQCAKLKCCLNFEVDTYVEASKKLPPKDAKLETADNLYYYFKADIFKREVTYSTDKSIPANLVTISARRAFEVIALNKNGEKPLTLQESEKEEKKKSSEYADILDQDSLTRFDKKKKKKKGQKGQGNGQNGQAQGNNGQVQGNGQGGNQNGEQKQPKPQQPKQPKQPKPNNDGQQKQKPNEGQKQPKQNNEGQQKQKPNDNGQQKPKGNNEAQKPNNGQGGQNGNAKQPKPQKQNPDRQGQRQQQQNRKQGPKPQGETKYQGEPKRQDNAKPQGEPKPKNNNPDNNQPS
jgi:cell fate regulator YaaT (PSP1 superfamily)